MRLSSDTLDISDFNFRLAAQREQYLRDKAAHTDMYQRALSAQVSSVILINLTAHHSFLFLALDCFILTTNSSLTISFPCHL